MGNGHNHVQLQCIVVNNVHLSNYVLLIVIQLLVQIFDEGKLKLTNFL